MHADASRVAAYCRVSTEKDEQLVSLAHQKAFFEEYAQKQGLTLVKVYADEGLSGTRLKNRHAFAELMRDAEHGLFGRVLVKDVSRMARNVVDFLQSVRRLRAMGVDCQFITSGMSLSDGELTLTILAAVAQEESANLSGRVKFGKRKNAAQGRVPNLIYGYDKVPGEYFTLRVNEREAMVVRQIFDWYASGAYGTNRIAALLTARGEKTKRGCAFTQAAVRRLLSHRIYIGEVVNGREYIADYLTGRRVQAEETQWLVRENPALAIIPREQFDCVQSMLAGRTQAFGGGARHRQYPLSGLLHCTCCGSSFRRLVRYTQAGERVRWVCAGRNANGTDFCENRTSIDENKLLGTLAEYLRAVGPNGALAQETARAYRRLQPPTQGREQAQRALKRSEQARERLLALYESGGLSLEDCQTRLQRLQEEAERTRTLCEQPACRHSVPPKDPLAISLLDSALLHALLERIDVHVDGHTAIVFRDLGHSI